MLSISSELQSKLITAVAKQIIMHEEELCRLDRAIGDGDHGTNLTRGFKAVLAEESSLSQLPLAEALHAIGMKLLMSIGGASGPLYGTLFMSLGKALSPAEDATNFATALGRAVSAVCARGKSHAGQKTLLDVLIPVQACLASAGTGLEFSLIKSVATAKAEATIPMTATCGRAAFLGERSVGHMDPGARSATLMILAVCDVLCGGRKSC